MTSDAKDKIQYGTAVAMLASGMVLTFCSFFMLGEGEIKSYIDDRLGVRKDSQEE